MEKIKMIKLKCPKCSVESKPVQACAGNKIVQCERCGLIIEYRWRKGIVRNTSYPKRTSSSGTTFY